MRILVFFIVFALIGPLSFSSVSLSGPDSTGTISGCVILPNALDTAKAPKEAKLYIYLKDYTPKDGKEVLAWEASIRKIIDFEIR